MCSSGADTLVIARDCAAGGSEEMGQALSLFRRFEGPRLLVPGNHDLWIEHPPLDTWKRYRETLPAIAAAHGFHYLDQAPFVLDGVGFIGCVGWYDYRFRQREPPVEGIWATPVYLAHGMGAALSLSPVPGVGEKSWAMLSGDDYAAKAIIWQTDGCPHVAVWNDGIHVDWGQSDPAMAKHFARHLRAQAREVADTVSQVVAVTDCVPFAEMAGGPFEEVAMAFGRAYMGSPLLGEALREIADLRLVICGHRHHQEVREIGDLVVADASVAEESEGPLLLTLPV